MERKNSQSKHKKNLSNIVNKSIKQTMLFFEDRNLLSNYYTPLPSKKPNKLDKFLISEKNNILSFNTVGGNRRKKTNSAIVDKNNTICRELFKKTGFSKLKPTHVKSISTAENMNNFINGYQGN